MKYILFAGNNYYPRGGWRDFQGFFQSIDQAYERHLFSLEGWEKAEPGRYTWFNIVDIEAWKIVKEEYET